MAEFFDVGSTRVVCLKKAGSSSVRHMLGRRCNGVAPTKYILCFIRNPYARLVSGWADLVSDRDCEWAKPHYPTKYDPQNFNEWAKVITGIKSDDLDHHFRPQYDELQTVFGQTDDEPDCQLWLGHLEKIDQLTDQVARMTGGDRVVSQSRRTSLHLPWHQYYDDELLGLVGRRYMKDVQMWLALNPEGWFLSPWGLNYKDELDRLIGSQRAVNT